MSVFLKDMLALYPGKSHIQNIGNDNSGTHCGETDLFKVELGCNANIDNVNILEDVHSRIKIEYFFNSIKPTLVQKIKRVIFSRDLLKLLVPPFFLKALRRIDNNKFGWQGDYTTWQEAKNTSTGYNSDAIIQAVKSSLLKVKSGEAVYERDSVIFDEIQYSWPLLAGLMFVAAKSSGQNLKVLDFGGSLGSTYYQNKRFLDELCSVSWSVVEQRRFVTVGREEFANDRLSFYYTVGECVENEQPNILLLSSVLQYIENPYELLDEILKYEFEYILIDRVTFNNETDKDKITVQKIKLENYDSIPCWLFSERDFYKYFNCLYVLVEDFELANERVKNKYEKGMIWKKR
jgi:putative methyltransferase (TIGR04325 family)